jgi:ketosteroid isomerase-like protein
MASELARRFMDALQGAERTGDVGPLADLFADDAELSNLGGTEPSRGREGAIHFWRAYLGVFERIGSTFTLVLEGDDAAALEWVSDGELAAGGPIHYAGVSLLEMGDGRVRRFRTYYNPAAFVAPAVPETAGSPRADEARPR